MVNLTVNGAQVAFDGDPTMPLMWYLRDELGLTGTKFGCGVALCGACTVHLNGEAVRSCGVPMSDVGGKAVVALTGLAMVGFLVAHLAGNLLIYAGPEAMTEYAAGLRKFPMLLLAARVGLVVVSVVHIVWAIKLNLGNKAARPTAYAVKNYRKASFSSRSTRFWRSSSISRQRESLASFPSHS